MSKYRTAIRFLFIAVLALPLSAFAASYEVKTLIDTDNNRSTGCTGFYPGGSTNGIDTILTTSVTLTGGTATVTGVTRQSCVPSVDFFNGAVPVDGGWNVGVSSSGDLTIESHLGPNIMTMDNVGTPRFVFMITSGELSDALTQPFSTGGGDIVLPHAGRSRAVATGPLRVITLDGDGGDWAGVVPLANGTDNAPALRFISAMGYAGASDFFFKFEVHTNPAAPTAHDDAYDLPTLGGTLSVSTLGVLTNDNPNGQSIAALLVDDPQHGTVALNANGGFVYSNDGAHVAQDQFHYIANGTLPSNIATVTIFMPGGKYTFTSADHVTFVAGDPSSFAVTVTGKPTPALTEEGALPAGITFVDNGNGTGTLSGTPGPSTVGIYPLIFHAEKNKPHQADQHFTLTINCPGITVNNPLTTTGQAGTAFSQAFTQSGGGGTITWSESGTLPTGITFNTTTGILSGTPTQAGAFPITVTATDASSCSGTGPAYNLVISCHTVTVTNPATSTGTANAAFNQTFTQSGAISGATFTLNSGTLPAGLTLSTAGVLSGTPTQTGSFPITVKVTDGQGCTGIGPTYNLTIGCQTITVTNPATNTGTANTAFSQTFTAGNTIGTTTFSINSGTLPTGLTLSSAGVLSGTPTQTGPFSITVKATDANGCFGVGATYTLTIACQVITVNNPATNTGTVNVAFSQTFTATNAIGATTFTTASTLPAGLTLAANGVLSGTPAQTGSFPIVVHVVDGNGCSADGAAYTLTIGCQVITVNNPATTTGTVNVAFNQTFTASNTIGALTFTTASTLPAGLSLSSGGVLSGTPTQTGSFPIVVHVVDGNGCSADGATYTLVIGCQTITVNNPGTSSGTVNIAFSQTFTSSNTVGSVTYATASTLPAGLSLANDGTLSGTPTEKGTFPIVVTVTDANNCPGTGTTYNLVIGCQVVTVNNPGTNSGTVNTFFSQTFTASNTIGTVTFTTGSALPTGLSLSSGGVLSGTPALTGTFPIDVTATDQNGCPGTGATYNLTIGCQVITVNNPANAAGTVNALFSETFTAGNTVGPLTFTTASTLPNGLSLSTAGVLSGTPAEKGPFPIIVHVVDGNGCAGDSATYNLSIACQTITVNNPATNTGTVSAPFTVSFGSSNTIGTVTYNTASTLPAGITLATDGTLSGTPTQPGPFQIFVTATDANSCTGTGAEYDLTIGCQTITVGNPATTSAPAGTPLSISFTQTGAIGTPVFTTSSTLPSGLTLDSDGTLHGTPIGNGPYPIVVTVTDDNLCTGTNSSYTLTLTCPTITVTNPGVSMGTAGTLFSQTFTQSGGQGTITWSESGTLPSGITLDPSSGLLSGTTHQVGTFSIFVTATDQNGCTGTGPQFDLIINCQTVTPSNPGVNTGTVDASFSQTFTVTGILDTVTWSATGPLPAGITLDPSTGILSGTPTEKGTFAITVTATDTNTCFGTTNYTLTINCQTITVSNPGVNSGTVDTFFSQSFTQTGAHGTATFTTSDPLPAGLTLSTAGLLSGTPTVKGPFDITVLVTDSNGCTGTSATYHLVINCQTITVNNPGTNTGTTGTFFTATFGQSGAHGTATFTTASPLPAGITLSAAGVLSGTTNQHTSFPITVTVTDSNGCTGTGATYTLTINCQTIIVSNPANADGTVAASFSEQFSQSGAIGGATFTTANTLPTGLTLDPDGLLHGTPTQSGNFPIVVTVTDSNGCTGSGANYTINIVCNVITVTPPGVTSGTAGVNYDQAFLQSGGNGTIAWTNTGDALPPGIVLDGVTGHLHGTATQTGTFNITVTATDANGCSGNVAFTLTINCQSVTVTNPPQTSVQAGVALDVVFTAGGILGTATWSETGDTLPGTIALNPSTGHLSGTTNTTGTFNIVVTATDTNGCFGTSNYTLTVTCPTILVTRSGGGSFPSNPIGSAYSQSVTASGGSGSYTFTVVAGSLPAGLSLAANGAISGSTTATGTFTFTVKAADTANPCFGTSSGFSIAVTPVGAPETYASTLVNNTQAFVTGGTTGTPATPAVQLSGRLTANDLPLGSVSAVAGTVSSTFGTNNVVIAADGTFLYTPPVSNLTTDSFTYTISSDTGGTGIPATSTATATLNFANRVWYVKDTAAGGGNGQSHSPFNNLASAQTAAAANDIIFIYTGNTATTPLAGGLSLQNGAKLWGEAFGLTVNTNVLVAVGATKPRIKNTAGAAVTVDTSAVTAGNRQNVEIKGMDLESTTAQAVNVTSNAANITSITIAADNIRGAATQGINLNQSSTGTFDATITGATITSTGNGIQGRTNTAGTMTIAASSNTLTVSGGNGIDIQTLAGASALRTSLDTEGVTASGTGILVNGAAAGTTTITSLLSNNISGFTGGAGIAVTSATFDLDPSTTAFDQVAGGSTVIGIGGNGVGTGGMILTTVKGDLSFTDLDIVNSSGTGLFASSAAAFNAGTGTGFQIAVPSSVGTIDSTGGPAVDLTTVTASLPFTSIKSATSATTGTSLTSVIGTVSAGSGSTISGTTGIAFAVTGGTVSVTYSGNITQAVNKDLVNVSGTHASGTITFDTGTLSASNGNGLVFNDADGFYNFNGTTTLTGGAAIGISNGSAGTFNFGIGTSITIVNGTAFGLTGTNTATTTYSGSITKTGTGALVNVSAHSGGTVTFQTGTISATNGTGLQLSNADGTYNFTGTTTLNGGDAGIDIDTNSSGTFTFGTGTTITNPTGDAFVMINSDANLTYSGSISDQDGYAIDINQHDAGTITFQTGNVTSSGASATGIRVQNSNAGTINFNQPAKTLSTQANIAVFLNANTGSTINFGNGGLGITTTTAAGLSVAGGGTINVNTGANPNTIGTTTGTGVLGTGFTGTLNLNSVASTVSGAGTGMNLGGGTLGGTGSSISSGGPALVLSGVALTNNAGMTSVTSSAGVNGISLTNVTGGTVLQPYTIAGGSLSGNSGSAFLVSGGSRVMSYSGSITQNTARAVDITTNAGGTITLSGAIGSNGGTGISVEGTAGIVTLSGVITLKGTSSVFKACSGTCASPAGSGLTINAPNAANSVGSTTAATTTAILIDHATIGASNVAFLSVNVTGGSKGISLNNTGSTGTFSITGTGTTAGTGGTIQNTSNRGIELISANNISLKNMNLTSNATTNGTTSTNCGATGAANANDTCSAAIHLKTVNTITIDNVTIDGSAQNGINGLNVIDLKIQGNSVIKNCGDESGESGVMIQNLSGNNTALTNSTFQNNRDWQFAFVNWNAGTLGTAGTPVTVSGCTFIGRGNTATSDDGFYGNPRSTGSTYINVTGSHFRSNFSYGVFFTANDTNNATINVTSCDFGTLGTTSTYNNSGVGIGVSNAAHVAYNVSTNQIFGSAFGTPGNGTAIIISTGLTTAGASIIGTINGNFIGDAATSGSGCTGHCNGISLLANGGGDMVFKSTVTSNQIHQVSAFGIQYIGGTITGAVTGTLHVNSNTIDTPEGGSSAGQAISIAAAASGVGGSVSTLCADVGNGGANSLSGSWDVGNGDVIRVSTLRGSVFTIGGMPGSGTQSAAAVATFVGSQNSAAPPLTSASNTASGGGTFLANNGNVCP